MNDLSPVNRPVTLAEIASVVGMTENKLKRLVDRSGIRPACRVGPVWVYGPREIHWIFDALEASSVTA